MLHTQHRFRLVRLLDPGDAAASLRRDVVEGLTATPRYLPPRWLYDERGCELFAEITRLDEYYPTRREHEILVEQRDRLAALGDVDTLVELGSGSSPKTRLLVDALLDAGGLRHFVALDVAESALREAARHWCEERPSLQVTAVVGDFERHLGALPADGRRLVALLGGTIGNLDPAARRRFLDALHAATRPGDRFLVGTDLVKDRARLVAAYDDARGVTAAFNRNVLCFLDRALGADFDPATFDHVAVFDEEQSWIEMRLRSRIGQVAHVPAVGLTVPFAAGEHLRTEISTKFTVAGIAAELRDAGLTPEEQWTDRAGDFALTLAVRP